MQLLVRKVVPKKGRTTRKQWQQRGGATWDSIDTLIGARKAKWVAEFAKNVTYQKLFGAIFTAPVDTDEKKKIRLEQWLNCMMYQEQLFDIAFTLYTDNGKDVEYFADVVRMINFSFDPVGTAAKSKIDLLYSASVTADFSGLTKGTLDFFESAFSNSFITSLAGIINMIKKNKDQLAIDKGVLSRYFAGVTRANALLLTGYDTIDGFYLDQGRGEFATSLGGAATFYTNFVEAVNEALKEKDISTYYTKFRAASKIPTRSIWYALTACVACLHFNDAIPSLLTLFNAPNTGADDVSFVELYKFIPDNSLVNIELPNKLNIYNIMKTLAVQSTTKTQKVPGDNLLHFIIHLAKRCVELETGDKFEMKSATEFFTAPAPAPSTA